MTLLKSRLVVIDFIKSISIIAVVLIHSISSNYDFNILGINRWIITMLIFSLLHWAVPFFVMSTGVLSFIKFNQNLDILKFLRKRLTRLILPFLFWTSIYLVYSNEFGLYGYFKYLFIEPIRYHFWFVFMIIEISVITPFIGIFLINTKERQIRIFLMIWFIYQVLVFMFKLFSLNLTFKINFLVGYAGYLVAGYWICKYKPKIKTEFLISIFILGFIIAFVGTVIEQVALNKFTYFWYDYLSPQIIIMSFSLFALIINFEIKNFLKGERIVSKLEMISRLSFGIYFVHVLIIEILERFGFRIVFLYPFIEIIVIFILTLILSFLIIYGLTRVEILKRFVA